MKKIKEYLNFLVDKETLSYVVSFYFSITISVIYSIICYNLTKLTFKNFFSFFLFACISIWFYFTLKLWYMLWKYIFTKLVEKKDISKIKSFFIFLYWTWSFFSISLLFSILLPFFEFSLLFYFMLFLYCNIIITIISFIFCLIELFTSKYKKLTILTLILVILYLIFFIFLKVYW